MTSQHSDLPPKALERSREPFGAVAKTKSRLWKQFAFGGEDLQGTVTKPSLFLSLIYELFKLTSLSQALS